ncbi:acetylcholine receptor subunit alpha-like isoform X3 [Mytilus californianus]|uniref:acetylcholine receptor subunit alpha-like isoform X3 n=1 Tax=Mytilus californianus TaxID=6549 RepID=UPI002247D6FB|nr:acetylcholine receptor subunit alpha-like isoform X3 [Mytilus californianus]
MSMTGYFQLSWDEERLAWDADPTYNSIRYIFSTSEYTWRPTLFIANSVGDLGIIDDDVNMMRILKEGKVNWAQMRMITTHCESDITYYPFDTQKCSIVLSTWSYSNSEVTILFDNNPVVMDFFSENGEWVYAGYGTSVYTEYRGDIFPFDMAKLEFKFVRRPGFMVMNIILPVIGVAILTSFVFKVAVDSGEKIGYCLTVMLAYAVYLTLVADNMPTTSVNISILSLYNLMVLIAGILSIPITLFILRCHHNVSNDPVPKWLLSTTSCFQKFLRKFLRISVCFCCRKKDKISTEVNFLKSKTVSIIDVIENEAYKMKQDDKQELAWSEISGIWDDFFFTVYMVFVIVITTIMMTTLLIGYCVYGQDES